jgi:hypothetical protein
MWLFPVAAVLAVWTLLTQIGPRTPDDRVSAPEAAQPAKADASASPQVQPETHIILLGTAPSDSAPGAPAGDEPAPPPAAIIPPGAPDADPDRLASVLQAELKRLGCYRGEIDNIWGRQSRGALRRFVHAASLKLNGNSPATELAATLRGYDNSTNCTASLLPAEEAVNAGKLSAAVHVHAQAVDDRSYLPPWMRDKPSVVETAAAMEDPILQPKPRRHRVNAASENRTAVAMTRKRQKKAVAGIVRRNVTANLQGWSGIWFGD